MFARINHLAITSDNYATNARFDQGFQDRIVRKGEKTSRQIVDEGIKLVQGWHAAGRRFLRGIGRDSATARALEQYGTYKIENGQPDAGKDLLREALAIYARLGMRRGERVQERLLNV